jgi:cation transport regulator ChaB
MEDTKERTLGEETQEEVDVTVDEGKDDGEDTVESLKERLEKAEQDKERYKSDLLALKKSGRADKQPKKDAVGESAVDAAINRRNEKSVLKRVTDENDEFFISELVNDDDFNKIVGYLPRNIDRSSEKSIHKALKLAVSAYKLDKGEKEEKKEKNTAAADVAATTKKPSSTSGDDGKNAPKSFKKQSQSINDWYKH